MTSEHDFARVQYHILHFIGSWYAFKLSHSYLRISGIAMSYVIQKSESLDFHFSFFCKSEFDFTSTIFSICPVDVFKDVFTHCLGTGAMPPVDVQVLEVGAIIFVRILSAQAFFACSIS